MHDDIVFETERLVARTWKIEYAEMALEMYGDPQVTKFLDRQTEKDVESMKAKLQKVIDRNKLVAEPFGSFAMFGKVDDALVGSALIKPLPDVEENLTEDIEIGWHLVRRFWGNGFATEFGKKLLQIGFETAKLDQIHAVVDLENQASKNVALRLGMTHIGQTTKYYKGQRIDHFVITAEEYSKLH